MPSEQVGSAYAEVGFKVDESGLNSAKSKFSSAIGEMEGKAKSVGSAIGGALKTGMEVGAVAVAGFATAGVKSYMDIESAAADAASKMDLSAIAQATGQTTSQAFDSVKEHVMSLADELGQLNTNAFDPTQIAQACANLAAGGFDVASASAEDLQDVLALATATNYDLSASAGMAMSTMNQFGMTVSDLGHISDVYATASGKSAAGMKDFDYAMQQAGPVAEGVGMSFEELTARISRLADAGYSGEKSGTALRTAMMKLSSPTQTQMDTLTKLGLTYDDVDPRVHSFGDTLDLLIAKGADIYDFGEIFGEEGAAIIYSTAKQSDSVKALTADLQNCDGAAADMAKNMLNTLKGSFDAAMGAASSLAYLIGGKLEPSLRGAFEWFSAEGAPAIRSFIEAVADEDWTKVGDLITKGIRASWAKLKDLGGQLIGWLQGVNWGGLGTYVTKGIIAAWGELKSLGGQLLDSLIAVDWGSIGTSILDSISSAIDSVIDYAEGIYDYFADIDWSGVWDSLVSAWDSAIESLSNVGSTILGYFDSIDWGTVGFKLGQAIRDAITKLADIGTTIWNYLVSADWSGAGSSITEKIKAGLETLGEYWGEFKAGFLAVDWSGAAIDIAEKIKAGFKKVTDWAVDIIDGIKKDFSDWITGGGPKTLGEDLAKAIVVGAQDLGEWIYDKVEAFWKGISGNGGSLGTTIYTAFKNIFTTLIDWAKLAFTAAYDFVVGFANTIITAGKGTIGAAILEIIGGAMNSAWDGAGTSLMEKASEWRKDAEKIFSDDDFDVDVSTTYTGAGNPKDLDGSTISVNVDYKSTTGAALTPYSTSGKTTVTSSDGEYYLKTKDFTQMNVKDWAKQMGQSGASYEEVLSMVQGMRTGSGDTVLSQKVIDQIMGAFVAGQDEYNKAHSGETEVEAAKEAATITVDASKEAADTTTTAAETAAAIATGAGKSIAEALQTTQESYLIASQTAANAISLGGGAVKVGLAEAGNAIAVIGSTAQKQWTDAGGTLYDKIIVAADGFVGAIDILTINIANSWAEAANSAVEKSQTASSNYQKAFENAGISWKSTAESTSKATMEELSTGMSKLTFKVAQSSDDFKGGISTAKTTWQYGVSTSVGTWSSGVGNSGSTLKLGASSAGSSMRSGGSDAGSSMRSGGATAASSMANALSYFSGSKWNYYGYAEGTITSGPQMAVIGEDGPQNPEYVIPTKTKRWDLLYSAMKAYGLSGFAEGTATGAATSGGAGADAAAKDATDPENMAAYFSITGLASMSKQVQRIITNLKDFFRISWAIVKSEGAAYWKEIENVLIAEVTTIRDGMWSAIIDIKNVALSSNSDILSDASSTWSAYWPTVEPSMTAISENATQSMADMRENIASQIDEMITDSESQMKTFEEKWKEIWTQLITDLNASKAKITTAVNQIAALLKSISVNTNININVNEYSSGGGGGGGSGGSGGGDWLGDDDFTIGCGIKLNSLSSGGSGSATGYYQLPKVFGGGGFYYAAKGALLDDGPQTIIAAEAGPELILPSNLTRMFMSLADAGLGSEAPETSGKIVIEDKTVNEHFWDGKKVTNLVMTETKKRLQLKGMPSVS